MSRWRGYVVVLVAAALAAAGCTRSDQPQGAPVSEVKIGLLAPLTGTDKALGEDARRGAQFAADLINTFNSQVPLPLAAQNGLPNLGGARIRITPADIAPAGSGANQTIKLTSSGVAALVGASDPEATLDASLRAEKLQVPFVNADTGLSFLTQRGLDWFFHIGISARTVGEAYFSLLKQEAAGHQQVSRIAVLHTNDKAGNDVANVVNELATEGGFTVVANVGYNADPAAGEANALDLRAQVSQIESRSPNAVFLAPTAATLPAIAAAFNALQYHPAGVMTFGTGLGDVISKAPGPITEGMCRETSWSTDLAERNPAARKVQELYQSKFKSPMSEEAASTFTAVYTLALAINDAGSTDARKVRSALLSVNLTGDQTIMPWDGIRFDETHQNQGAESVIEQFRSKGFRPVFPRDAVASLGDDLVWPAG